MTPTTSLKPESADCDATLRPVSPGEMRPALGLLLTGHADGSQDAVEQFLQFARSHAMGLDGLWGAFRGNQLLATCMLLPSQGRAMMVFVSPTTEQSPASLLAALSDRAVAAQDPQRVHLVQALLDPWQRGEAEALRQASFTALATLIYMQRTVRRFDPQPLRLDPYHEQLTVSTWHQTKARLFERAILASYEATRDCPGLVGMREIEDIIAGHRGGGTFDPDLWFVLHQDDEPAGVMLLNRLADRDAMELVYLGLAVPWRGKGLARRLVQFGLSRSHESGATQVLLAVDEANQPAVNLYRSMQFLATGRKVAMIRGLRGSPRQ